MVDVLAVRGTVLLGLLSVAAAGSPSLARLAGREDAGADGRIVRVEGDVGRPGWYAARSVADALGQAEAGDVVGVVGEVGEGETVRVTGGYASVGAAPSAVVVRTVDEDPRVSLNHATVEQLEGLPRVGPVLARRIVEARPFRRVAELDRVKGVGPSTMRLLRPRVRP